MGQTESKLPANKDKSKQRPPLTFGKKSDINKNDYIFSKRVNESIVKQQGSIDGQQFIIEESRGCDIFLLDHIACVTVDQCKDCRIITGPIESSIFIRDCTDCIIVTICQQLRLRDCSNLKVFLCSTTGPIIETSRNITFGCYDYNYFGLADHFRAANLSVWNNSWFDVYDFNPSGGSGNFKLLDAREKAGVGVHDTNSLDSLIPAVAALGLEAQDLAPSPRLTRLVPRTYGPAKALIRAYKSARTPPPTLPTVASNTATVCVPDLSPANAAADTEHTISRVVDGWSAGTGTGASTDGQPAGQLVSVLCRTTCRKFTTEQLDALCPKGWSTGVTGGSLLVLELFGEASQLTKLLAALRSQISPDCAVLYFEGVDSEQKIKLIFDDWKIVV